jgi:hypothetical protein
MTSEYADEALIASGLAADPPLMGSDYSTRTNGYERYPGLRRRTTKVSAEEARAQLLADLELEAAMSADIDRTAPRCGRPEPREWDHDAS